MYRKATTQSPEATDNQVGCGGFQYKLTARGSHWKLWVCILSVSHNDLAHMTATADQGKGGSNAVELESCDGPDGLQMSIFKKAEDSGKQTK